MSWRLARSLATLRAEFDAYAPRRSKRSDGTIGDPAHAARASRHNPNRYGVVTALDITYDPAGGCDVHAIVRRLVHDPHPELAYIVSNGQIASRRDGFRWRKYTGSNPHTSHAHIAVGVGPDSDPMPPYDSTVPWGVNPHSKEWWMDTLVYARKRTPDAEVARLAASERGVGFTSNVNDARDAKAAGVNVIEVGGHGAGVPQDVKGATWIVGSDVFDTIVKVGQAARSW